MKFGPMDGIKFRPIFKGLLLNLKYAAGFELLDLL